MPYLWPAGRSTGLSSREIVPDSVFELFCLPSFRLTSEINRGFDLVVTHDAGQILKPRNRRS